jgi:hypothetical protein
MRGWTGNRSVITGKKTLKAVKLIRGLVVFPPRLCMGIKTLKSLKRHEGKSKRRVLTASCKDQDFKEHTKAYERSHVETIHGRIQKK